MARANPFFFIIFLFVPLLSPSAYGSPSQGELIKKALKIALLQSAGVKEGEVEGKNKISEVRDYSEVWEILLTDGSTCTAQITKTYGRLECQTRRPAIHRNTERPVLAAFSRLGGEFPSFLGKEKNSLLIETLDKPKHVFFQDARHTTRRDNDSGTLLVGRPDGEFSCSIQARYKENGLGTFLGMSSPLSNLYKKLRYSNREMPEIALIQKYQALSWQDCHRISMELLAQQVRKSRTGCRLEMAYSTLLGFGRRYQEAVVLFRWSFNQAEYTEGSVKSAKGDVSCDSGFEPKADQLTTN
jgi:hypothetical protein